MEIYSYIGNVVIGTTVMATADELIYTRSTNEFTIQKRGTSLYDITADYDEFTTKLTSTRTSIRFADADELEDFLTNLGVTDTPTPTPGSVFDYVKCTSGGLTSGTGLRKIPLTVSVAATSAYSVASDTITVDEGTTHEIKGQIAIRSTVQRPQFVVLIYKNGAYDGRERGSAYIRNSGISYDWWNVKFNTIKNLSPTDTIEIYVDQRRGGTRGTSGTSAYTVEGQDCEIIMERKV